MVSKYNSFSNKGKQILSQKLYEEYQLARVIPSEYKNVLCYAPLRSLNFDQSGDITACCYNRKYVLGQYPKNSIKEIWQGEKNKSLHKYLQDKDFSQGCSACHQALSSHNFSGALLNFYDSYCGNTDLLEWPATFVFEIANTCNLECIMCGGKWSSAIRRNREKLPPLPQPYDREFVRQVKEFLPHLEVISFLGGEPFLIPLYFDIWESIAKINPSLKIEITTNGTILNTRIKKILDALPNCRITISVDSLDPANYENIRKNSVFSELRQNIEYYLSTGKLVSFSVCPMLQNWMDIPDIFKYCAQHNLDIYINTVYFALGGYLEGIHENSKQSCMVKVSDTINETSNNKTILDAMIPKFSLMDAPKEKLQEILQYYEGFSFSPRYQTRLDGLKNQIKAWLEEG